MTDREKLTKVLDILGIVFDVRIKKENDFVEVEDIRRFHFNERDEVVDVEDLDE